MLVIGCVIDCTGVVIDTADMLDNGGREGPVHVIVEGTEAFEKEGTIAVADVQCDVATLLTTGWKTGAEKLSEDSGVAPNIRMSVILLKEETENVGATETGHANEEQVTQTCQSIAFHAIHSEWANFIAFIANSHVL